MNTTELFSLIEEFQAIYGRVYRYAGRSWWRFDPDQGCWTSVDVRRWMAQAFQNLAADKYPNNERIQRQVGRDYMTDRLIKGLVPGLSADTLPSNPFTAPGSQ